MSSLSAVACVVGLVACGGGQQQANAPASENVQSSTASSQSAPADMSADAGPMQSDMTASAAKADSGAPMGATNAMASPATPDITGYTDAQLAAVVKAINDGEIAAAQAASTTAMSPEVKKFAAHMISQHREMETKDAAILAKLNVTPNDNAVSNQLKSDSQTELSGLKGATGKDFDRDYIDAQVRDHAKALDMVDRILAEADSSDFKADLKAARPKIEMHLHQAEKIQQSLQKGGASSSAGSTGMPHGKKGAASTDSTSPSTDSMQH